MLWLSIAFNLIFFVTGLSVIIYKWYAIEVWIDNQLHSSTPSDTQLLNFNNSAHPVKTASLSVGADSTISVLFLGNSLTLTDVPVELTDKTLRGMTATTPEKDYVHRLVRMVARQKDVNVSYATLNIANFERSFARYDISFDSLFRDVPTRKPDFLIVQIGENVRSGDILDPSRFKTEYLRLISYFQPHRTIISLPFWPDPAKEYAITDVALASGATLIDLSHLGNGNDPSNFARSQRHYSLPGVDTHPSDTAMHRIALSFLTAFN